MLAEPLTETETEVNNSTSISAPPKEAKKRGRKPLTPEQRLISEQNKRKYFQEYYKNHPDKYTHGNDYSKGKIYMLVSKDTDKIYIGGTALPLEARHNVHMYRMHTNPSSTYKKMLELSKNWEIRLLVTCPTKDRETLEQLETIWITANAYRCLNNRKKFSMDAIKYLLDGRFANSLLPPDVKNFNKKKISKKSN